MNLTIYDRLESLIPLSDNSSRIRKAAVIAPTVIAKIVDGVLGTVVAIPTLICLGQSDTLNKYTAFHLQSFGGAASEPFKIFLQILNPNALTRNKTLRVNGLFTSHVRQFMYSLRPDDKACFLRRHIENRLNTALRLLATVVTRVVELAIGAVAATLATLTLGSFDKINFTAYAGLQGLRLPGEIVFDLRLLLTGA